MVVGTWLIGAIGLLAGTACEPEETCTRGDEGCYCTADYRCLEGLACRSYLCIDPEWSPPEPEVAADGGNGNGADDGKTVDNVSACEEWLDALECGGVSLGDELAGAIACDSYAQYGCRLDGYFECLTANTKCDGDVPDVTGWSACAGKLSC